MNETKPDSGGDKSREPRKFRRTRNLPLILMLVGLMVIVLMNIDPEGEKTALITYAQFQELGRIPAAHLDLAQSRNVDDPNLVT